MSKNAQCLHCDINRVIDVHNERVHTTTGEPVKGQGVPAVWRSWLGQGDARPVAARKAVDPPVVLA